MSVIEKKKLAIGTIGHVDHGKTTLTSAITKIANELSGIGDVKRYDEIDNAPEEKARGITISAAHVCYYHKDTMIMHTDCPGHADYIKNMIVGASQMEGCILVIAATDGVMLQTQEHLKLAKSNVPSENLVVFVNKSEVAGEEMCELVAEEVRDYVIKAGFAEDTPIIFGSALCALEERDHHIGRDKIIELLDIIVTRFVSKVEDGDESKPVLITVEGTNNIPGRGNVATGRAMYGTIVCDDGKPVDLVYFDFRSPYPKPLVVTSFEMFHKPLTRVTPGDNVGALCRGIKKGEIARGMLICGVDTKIKAARKVKAEIYIYKKEEGGRNTAICNGYKPQLYLNTADITVSVGLLEGVDFIMPGENATVILEFINDQYMPVEIGWQFALREGGLTISLGKILEIVE